MNDIVIPSRLQFRLRNFNENDSTDSFLQGANDEVWMSATGIDSSSVRVGPDKKPVVDLIDSQRVGDVSEDDIRGPWRNEPHVLIDFNLQQAGDFPRTYTITLFIVEHDNGDLERAFNELHQQVGNEIKAAVVAAAVEAGASVGASVGSAIPGIGTLVGAAAGALAAVAYNELVSLIDEGLGDDVFLPIPITLTVENPSLVGEQPGVGIEQALKVQQHECDYDIFYDWHVVPDAMSLARSHLTSSARLADVPEPAEAIAAAQAAVDVLHRFEPSPDGRAEYLSLLADALRAVVQRLMQGGRLAEVVQPA
ncbi:hypothetical protein, partial [Kitasatospora sp. NPDC056181]|uniref:hypothetical protein n=1 Tax=Kitasatospora sp. NPDC056181 TaxID=3345737 RepID=UPI0035DA4DDF